MPDAIGDDLALLRSYAQRADASAFAELVRRYAAMVYATAQRVTGDSAAAEDVSQDCFLRLAQRSASVTGSIGAWLHRTSLNRSLELLRSERSRRAREARIAAERSTDTVRDDSGELIARVDETLVALPDELRIVVTEHFLCGRSQTDIADALGVDQSTVSRRIDAGVKRLRQALNDDDRDRAPLALGALPMLLSSLGQTAAPTGLQQTLIKIGLSGVRAAGSAVVGTGARSTFLKVLMIVFGSACTLTGGALVYRWAFPPAATAPMVPLPSAVRATLDGSSAGATILESERKRDGDQIVYDLDILLDGKKYELRIAESGRLIWKKPLPTRTLPKQTPGETNR